MDFSNLNIRNLSDEQIESLIQYFGRLKASEEGNVGMSSVIRRQKTFLNRITVNVRIGDLTKEKVDVIVNAANAHLQHSGGLARAIANAAGPALVMESRAIARETRLDPGDVVATTPGNLEKFGIKSVFHAIGPIFPLLDRNAKYADVMSLEEDLQLFHCIYSSLAMADERKYNTISIPAVSSGIFGFAKDRCAEILFNAFDEFVSRCGETTSLTEVNFTNFDEETVTAFEMEFDRRYEGEYEGEGYEGEGYEGEYEGEEGNEKGENESKEDENQENE